MEIYNIRACKHWILYKPAAINKGDMLKYITHKIDIGKFQNSIQLKKDQSNRNK